MKLNEAVEALRFDLDSYLAGADGREHEAVTTLIEAVERVLALCESRERDCEAVSVPIHHAHLSPAAVRAALYGKGRS